MKSVRNKMIYKEDAEKLVSVGSATSPKNDYTKADFMTPGRVAKKFNISIEKAKTLMKTLSFRNASFVLNGHLTRVIVDLGKRGQMYLHPMGIKVFEQLLSKQKD